MLFLFMFGQVDFESFGEFASRKHNTPPAPFTLQSNIRAETCDSPFVGAARMLFAESQVIVEVKVGEHEVGRQKAECRMQNEVWKYYKLNCDKLRARNFG
jgi:hypothetical protein